MKNKNFAQRKYLKMYDRFRFPPGILQAFSSVYGEVDDDLMVQKRPLKAPPGRDVATQTMLAPIGEEEEHSIVLHSPPPEYNDLSFSSSSSAHSDPDDASDSSLHKNNQTNFPADDDADVVCDLAFSPPESESRGDNFDQSDGRVPVICIIDRQSSDHVTTDPKQEGGSDLELNSDLLDSCDDLGAAITTGNSEESLDYGVSVADSSSCEQCTPIKRGGMDALLTSPEQFNPYRHAEIICATLGADGSPANGICVAGFISPSTSVVLSGQDGDIACEWLDGGGERADHTSQMCKPADLNGNNTDLDHRYSLRSSVTSPSDHDDVTKHVTGGELKPLKGPSEPTERSSAFMGDGFQQTRL